MKTLLLLSAAAAMLLGSCTTTRFASSEADGIYYIPRQAPIRQAQQEIPRGQGIAHDDHRMPTNAVPQQQHQEYTEYADEQYYTENNQTYYEDSGNLRSTRHFYKDELMHDFSFASRIRRFHRPQYRWSYFDPWFTNMFWYTHNPNYFGVSIYHGFGSLAFHFPAFMHFQPGFYWYTWASPFHWYSPAAFLPKILMDSFVICIVGNCFNKSIVSFPLVIKFPFILMKYPLELAFIKLFCPTINTSLR